MRNLDATATVVGTVLPYSQLLPRLSEQGLDPAALVSAIAR
jgi:hypothetical protein